MKYLMIDKTDEKIAVITIDCPDTTANTFSTALLSEVEQSIDDVLNDHQIKALVITSAKEDTFLAGADLDEVRAMETKEEVTRYISKANSILNRLEATPKPVVCAIHGNCLGGGLELALVADYRIASDSAKTVFGLPEVMLGLIPAAGGTQRLPELIGLPEALPLILTGKQLRVKKAKKLGLIDEIIPPYDMTASAVKAASLLAQGKINKKPVKRSVINRMLEKSALGRSLVFKQAEKGVMKQTKGIYPAPLEIIRSVEFGIKHGIESGIRQDIKRFCSLALSSESKALTNLFFAMNKRKKNKLQAKAVPVKKLGVLGAGLMGYGIAGVSTHLCDTILLKDVSLEAAAKGVSEISKGLAIKARSGALTHFESLAQTAKVIPCNTYKGFKGCDLVVEAVFEDLALKRQILKDVEDSTGDTTIFASNTSSLPISEIAKNSRRPGNVIGMHYFSPVRSMPLLEIITTDQTEEWVTATAIDFGIKQGKTCIVVKDGPAFYTTRILVLMLNEAMLLVEEGVDIQTIDETMMKFGYPVGPVKLIDEVGIDVGFHVGKVMEESLASREMKSSTVIQQLFEKGFQGRKNKKGFYQYKGKKRKRAANPDVNKLLKVKKATSVNSEEIQNRISLTMVNEAILCLQEGIIQSPEDGDIGAILGLGFPPLTGGPFSYVDSKGPENILTILESYRQKFGKRFTPADLLVELVKSNGSFYK